MADIPVFALQDALERVDNDVELLKELIQIFFQEYGREVLSLQQALTNKDAQSFVRSAHSLKGAALNVGALQVAREAAALESLEGAAHEQNGPEFLQRLSTAVDTFRVQQQAQLSSRSGKV